MSCKIRFDALNNVFLESLDRQEEYAQSSIDYNSFLNKNVIPQTNPSFNLVEQFEPMWLNAKNNHEDIPTWHKATTGPHRDGFWKAMKTELETLERIKAWSVVERAKNMNILDSIWAFKTKRYPDGNLRTL